MTGSTTLPAFLTWSNYFQQLTVTLSTSSSMGVYVGNYHFQVQYTLGGITLNENINLVIIPAMTNDPRSPNHTMTTCTEHNYPIYIGGTGIGNIGIESGYVDSFGNFLLTGGAWVGPYSWISGTLQAFIALMD